MDTKQMTPEEFLKFLNDNDGEPDGVTVVEDDEWTQDHKYQHRALVYRLDASGQHFQVNESRSGSYHTDWYYNDPDCWEVFPVVETKTITVTTWATKKPEVANG